MGGEEEIPQKEKMLLSKLLSISRRLGVECGGALCADGSIMVISGGEKSVAAPSLFACPVGTACEVSAHTHPGDPTPSPEDICHDFVYARKMACVIDSRSGEYLCIDLSNLDITERRDLCRMALVALSNASMLAGKNAPTVYRRLLMEMLRKWAEAGKIKIITGRVTPSPVSPEEVGQVLSLLQPQKRTEPSQESQTPPRAQTPSRASS